MRGNPPFPKSWLAHLGAVILGAALSLATLSGPALADSDGTGFDPTGRGNALMEPWAMGNAYKNHRDYAEDRDVEKECGGCHDIYSMGYAQVGVEDVIGSRGGFAPGCLSCHGKKWDRGSSQPANVAPGEQVMNSIYGWTNAQKQHRDFVEDNGVDSCRGCHMTVIDGNVVELAYGGKANSSTYTAPGCLSCHGVKWDDGDDRDGDRHHDGDSDSD